MDANLGIELHTDADMTRTSYRYACILIFWLKCETPHAAHEDRSKAEVWWRCFPMQASSVLPAVRPHRPVSREVSSVGFRSVHSTVRLESQNLLLNVLKE